MQSENQRTELTPLFVAPAFSNRIKLIEVMWRYDFQNHRHYVRKNMSVYKSLTTFISAVESTPIHLNTWREGLIEDLGSSEKVDQFVDATASYGTASHELLAVAAREEKVDWKVFETMGKQMLIDQGLTGKPLAAAYKDLLNDTSCFLQFIHDYNVTILAVEIPCWIDEGIATLIDFVLTKDERKYEATPVSKRKRHNCIINWKTSRKGSFESHVLQLEGERRMFNNVYGKRFGEITEVYNLAPTNWQDTPKYKLTHQTPKLSADNGRLIKLFTNYLERAEINGILGEPKVKFKTFKGVTKLGESPINQLFFQDYKQFIEDKTNFDEEPEPDTITRGSASTINKVIKKKDA